MCNATILTSIKKTLKKVTKLLLHLETGTERRTFDTAPRGMAGGGGEDGEENSSATWVGKKNGYFRFIKIDFLRSNFKFLSPKF